jgi:hypothetical protein
MVHLLISLTGAAPLSQQWKWRQPAAADDDKKCPSTGNSKVITEQRLQTPAKQQQQL